MVEYFALKDYSLDELMKLAMPMGPDGNEINEVQPQPPIQPEQPAVQPIQPVNQPQEQPMQPVDQPQVPQQQQKEVQFLEEKAWGTWTTIIVSIPQLAMQEKNQLDKLALDYIEGHKKADGTYPPWATWKNRFKQNRTEVATFKLFSGVKEKQGCYAIATAEPDFFHEVLEYLGQKGFNTEHIKGFYHQPQVNEPIEQNLQQEQPNANQVSVELPEWNLLRIKFKKDDEVTKYNREQRVGGKWNRDLFAWEFSNCLPDKLRGLANFMKNRGFIVEQFLEAIENYDKALADFKKNAKDPLRTLVVKDVSQNTRFYIAVQFPKTKELAGELSEFLKFSFPSEGSMFEDMKPPFEGQPPAQVEGQPPVHRKRIEPTGMRVASGGNWFLYGKFDDFVRFGHLLKNTKWDVDAYRRLLAVLIKNNTLEKTRFTGELDGYAARGEQGQHLRDKNGNPLFDVEKFYKDTDEMVVGGQLLPKQKQGVAWLYSRNSAIIGDKAGTGKTLETIAATAMRLKQSGGRALIFVLKNTLEQWKQEIKNWLGEEEGRNVSTDPGSNAKWIIVPYSAISAIPLKDAEGNIKKLPNGAPVFAPKKHRTQALVNKLFDTRFTVLVMDEAHVLKKETSGMSRVINALAPKIPFKWGATATAAANTSADLHNLLAVTGHSLGSLSTRDFNREFVGGKMTLKNMASEEIVQAQELAAYNLRKWLTLSGAYLSRSMRAMNENLPPHEIGVLEIPAEEFDMEAFAREWKDKLSKYKSQAQAICALTAQRLTLAKMKVPYTLKEATNLLDEGRRVLIFSCFRETCRDLVSGLRAHLARIDPDAIVSTLTDGDNSDAIQQSINLFKDTESPARAMVIASLKGGTGVSLPNTTEDVLMNDYDWTPRVTEQTEGRAYRINNVVPVNTRYPIIKGNGTPDEMFYNYVRTKIRLSGIIQDLDSEAEEYILAGLDDAEIQKQIREAREQDRQANINLVQNLDAMLRPYGVNILGEQDADMVGGQLDLDEAYEDIQLLPDEDEPPIRASGWYNTLMKW